MKGNEKMKKKIVSWEDAVEHKKKIFHYSEETKRIDKVFGLSKDNIPWGNEVGVLSLNDNGPFLVKGKDNFGEDEYFALPDWLFEQ